MSSRRRRGPGYFHAVRFYKDSDSLCKTVGSFLKDGFAESQPAVVIATADHGRMISECLAAQGIDVRDLMATRQLVVVDANAMLSQFMVDGMPNQSLFKQIVTPVLEEACAQRAHCIVRAYGEMVDILWKAGQMVAATRLELLWNNLAQTHEFSLVCGYSMGNFYKEGAIEEICGHHSHVLVDPPSPKLSIVIH
jgi:hypothetical protein